MRFRRGIIAAAALLSMFGAACADSNPVSPPRTQPQSQSFQPAIAGDYTVTITAAASCSLPLEATARIYTARVTEPSPGYVLVKLSGGNFLPQLAPGFEGTRNADGVVFHLSKGSLYWVAERVADQEIFYSGSGPATIGADGIITGSINGQIWVSRPGDLYDWIADCRALDHSIVFTRR